MSWFSKVAQAARFKRLESITFPRGSWLFFNSVGRATDAEITREVGDGTGANVFMTPVRWLQRSITESDPVLMREDAPEREHPLTRLLSQPNQFYSGEHLLAATVLSLSVDGNAYWLILSNSLGQPVELWWVPHTMIEPKWPDDGNEYLSHYEYNVGGKKQRLEPDDVIHFRDGLDPQNIRKGLSPLRALMREVWTDTEAANMAASLMKNGGVPGIVVAPDSDEPIDPADAQATKEYIEQQFSREKRGKALVLTGKTKVQSFGFNPKELDMSGLRNISEERVCAALGIPAAVVGFGTGIEQTKVGATLRELRRLAWLNGVIPLQRLVAGELNTKLLRLYRGPTTRNATVAFDNSNVVALQEDDNERAERVQGNYKAGIWTRAEAREATGKETTPADDVFAVPFSTVLLPRTSAAMPGVDERIGSGTFTRRFEIIETKQHQHTLTEQRISDSAPRIGTVPANLARLANSFDSMKVQLAPLMAADLEEFFKQLGDAAYTAALPFVKQALEAEQIAEGLAMSERLPIYQGIYEKHGLRILEQVDQEVSAAIDVAVGIPDPEARAVVAALGRRAGLVDLSEQSKRAIFDALTEGRAMGLAGDGLARHIRSHVERGPWSTPTIRARVIARTETAFGVNTSTIAKARSVPGIERALVFDNRIGYNDEICTLLDGAVVTLDEASQLTADEHPNGTRSFTPLPPGFEV